MPKTIIADTSCFIILTNIGELEILHKVYENVVTTADIAAEYIEKLPEWVTIEKVVDVYKQQILEMQIDKGESSAIALALETPGSMVILDDYKARRIAEKLELTFTGTLGVIVKAKLKGVIPSVKPIISKMKKTDFRISADVEQQAHYEAGE